MTSDFGENPFVILTQITEEDIQKLIEAVRQNKIQGFVYKEHGFIRFHVSPKAFPLFSSQAIWNESIKKCLSVSRSPFAYDEKEGILFLSLRAKYVTTISVRQFLSVQHKRQNAK